jgi:uncharacterized protein (TIGR00299 family) protein
MNIAYLDCFSGISGDMLLGALLDAGLPFKEMEKAIHSLPLTGYTLHAHKEKRNGLVGTRFIVTVNEETHPHRRLEDIKTIIRKGDLSDTTQEKAIQIFTSIAEEEAKVHDCALDEIQFHEVGAVDSIVDIVGGVFGIAFLEIKSLYVSPLPLGTGFVDTAHGRIPIPAPATIALLKGVPVHHSGLSQEMVTPTGAALVQGLADSFGTMPPMVVKAVGYGVGSRQLPDRPNLLRILIGKQQTDKQVETVVMLEANLDDMNPEWWGYMMEQLLNAGAMDVIFYPVQMKKNRPGIHLEVMGRPQDKEMLMDIIFNETTTLGVRFHYGQRTILNRTIDQINTPWGVMDVKRIARSDGTSFIVPEYEACRKIALTNNLSLKEVYAWVVGINRS